MIYFVNREDSDQHPTDDEISTAANSLLARPDVMLPDGVLEIMLCDHKAIIELNNEFRRESTTTDVLAFEMLEEDPETSQLIVGSIAVNSTLAREKAAEYCKEPNADKDSAQKYGDAEVLLYVLHGILHFAGYDDELPEDRLEMFDIACDVLARLNYKLIPYDFSWEV